VYLETAALEVGGSFDVVDELNDASYSWGGSGNYVRLDPAASPGHVLSVLRP